MRELLIPFLAAIAFPTAVNAFPWNKDIVVKTDLGEQFIIKDSAITVLNFGKDEILKEIQTEFEIEPIDLSSSTEVAKRYRYKDKTSEFGLVTSVTQPFCGGCTRARVSADGKLYTCLFASTGLDLKKILRSEKYDNTTLLSVLSKHWGLRNDRYSELRAVNKSAQEKVEMSYIGG